MRALRPGKVRLSPNPLRRIVVAVSAALAATLAVASPALAHRGGPEWSQFQGDPGHSGRLSDGPAPPYRVRWTLQAPAGTALSGAVVSDGLAFTVGHEAVYAVDVVTGQITWEVPRAGGPLAIPAIAVAGPGTPALLFLEGPDEEDEAPDGEATTSSSPSASPSPPDADPDAEAGSDLVAIGLEDQEELWRAPLEDTSRIGITVEGDTAFVADEGGSVYAVALADGEVRWTADAGANVDTPLAVADRLVVSVARNVDDRTVVLSAFGRDDGERRWRVSPEIGSSAASAAAVGDGRVVIGMADRFARALGEEGGDQVWASLVLSAFSPVTSPALLPGTVILADVNGGLYQLDTEDGGRDWSYQLNDIVLRSSPVVSGQTVLIGLNDGRLVAVDSGSGNLVWESEAEPGLVGAIALAHDAVIVVKGGHDAGLVAYEHDPDGVLLDVPSPTQLEPGTTLGRFGLASAIVLVVTLVPALWLRRRFGDAFPAADEDGDGADDAPADATGEEP
ncbi:MAG: outer membrane protein assembly factor BamB family protein [Actinomycetota bacterium]